LTEVVVSSQVLIEVFFADGVFLRERFLLVSEKLELPGRPADLSLAKPRRVRCELASDERPEAAGTSRGLVAAEGGSGGSCESTRPEATFLNA